MTHTQLIQELEFRARCIRTCARSIRGEIKDSSSTSGQDGRLSANAASLEYAANNLRQLAHLIKEGEVNP